MPDQRAVLAGDGRRVAATGADVPGVQAHADERRVEPVGNVAVTSAGVSMYVPMCGWNARRRPAAIVSSASAWRTSAKPSPCVIGEPRRPVVSRRGRPQRIAIVAYPSRATHSTSPSPSYEEAQAFATDRPGRPSAEPRSALPAALRRPRRAGGRVPASIARRAVTLGEAEAELAALVPKARDLVEERARVSMPIRSSSTSTLFQRIGTVAIEASGRASPGRRSRLPQVRGGPPGGPGFTGSSSSLRTG